MLWVLGDAGWQLGTAVCGLSVGGNTGNVGGAWPEHGKVWVHASDLG